MAAKTNGNQRSGATPVHPDVVGRAGQSSGGGDAFHAITPKYPPRSARPKAVSRCACHRTPKLPSRLQTASNFEMHRVAFQLWPAEIRKRWLDSPRCFSIIIF
jgi:hypothetical protein